MWHLKNLSAIFDRQIFVKNCCARKQKKAYKKIELTISPHNFMGYR